ncbi:MAG: ABC transporter substrate-binding protein [Nocardioides sp.]
MHVSRRALSAAVTTALACLLVAGCTTDAAPSAPSPSASAPSPSPAQSSTASGPVTLTLGIYGDRELRSGFARLADAYTAAHPDVTVELEQEDTAESFADRLEREASVGDEPDVFMADSLQVPRLAAEQRIQHVDGLLEERGVTFGDNYQRLGLEALSADQALQCMPYDVSPLVVLYNQGLVPFQRLIEDGDDPLTPETGWTWEQFTKAVRLMSHDGVNGVYVEPRLSTLMALVRSAGADIVDDPRHATTLTLSDDSTREALEQILDVLREPRFTPSQAKLERKDALSRFEDGEIGMILATRDVVPELRHADDLDFDVFPLPRISRTRTVADVTGLCLSASTPHVDAAADFLAFATGPEGQAILAETGEVVPAHLPTLNSDAFVQPGQQPESVGVFGNALAHAGVAPYVRSWPELVDATRAELVRMFYAPVIDLDEMLPRLDEQSREILAPPPQSPSPSPLTD